MLELKVPPVALVLLTAAAMWGIASATASFSWQLPYRKIAALIFAAAGGIVAILGVIAFRRVRTTVNPTRPQTASTLVHSGIYRFSRNPMYLGLLLTLLGFAIFLGNAPALVLVPAFVAYMNRYQIAPEERALLAIFGEEFGAYARSVRRWV